MTCSNERSCRRLIGFGATTAIFAIVSIAHAESLPGAAIHLAAHQVGEGERAFLFAADDRLLDRLRIIPAFSPVFSGLAVGDVAGDPLDHEDEIIIGNGRNVETMIRPVAFSTVSSDRLPQDVLHEMLPAPPVGHDQDRKGASKVFQRVQLSSAGDCTSGQRARSSSRGAPWIPPPVR